MSKGDKRRPAQITQEELAKRWEMAFKPKQDKKNENSDDKNTSGTAGAER